MCAFFACALHVWQIKGHRTKYTVFFSVQHVLLGKKKDAIHCVTIISACQTAVNRCRWSATANNALHGTDPPRREDTYKTFFVPRPRVPCRATPRIKARCRAINSRFYPIWVGQGCRVAQCGQRVGRAGRAGRAGRPQGSPLHLCTPTSLHISARVSPTPLHPYTFTHLHICTFQGCPMRSTCRGDPCGLPYAPT